MTLIWTALPAGVRREGEGAGWLARVSVAVTVRLEPTGEAATLAQFPEFLDWPKTLREGSSGGIEFEATVRSGSDVIATSVVRSDPSGVHTPDSQAWRRIFDGDTRVEPFEVSKEPGRKGSTVESYDACELLDEVRNYYSAALSHHLGATTLTPPLNRFCIAPERMAAAKAINEDAIEQFARFNRAAPTSGRRHRASKPPTPDFHQIIAALGSHPRLLRKLGLVLDFHVPLKELGLDDAGPESMIRLLPKNVDLPSVNHAHHWTAFSYRVGSSATFRLFQVAERNSEDTSGFLALRRDTKIAQEKLEHAALTLMQQAQTDDRGSAIPPALLQGGMRVTHAQVPATIETAMREQARLESALLSRKRNLTGSGMDDDDEEPLYADQLTRGVRADVRSVDAGPWRSLCRREVRYRAGGWLWPARAEPLEDEGVIEPAAYVDRNAVSSTLRVTQDLFEWDGWSLVVPRPEKEGDGDATLLPAELLPGGADPLTARVQVPAGTLEPQRFGRCYAFRTRTVDIAGNSLSVDEADEIEADTRERELATEPVCCLRVESAKPPVLFRAQARGPGEAGDVVVLRDADESRHRTHEFKLHVLPPEVPLRIAEKHGVFDAFSAEESWRLIRGHRGTLGLDADNLDADNKEIEARVEQELYTPYLPDPMVKQAVLRLPDDAGTVDMPPFDHLPRPMKGKELARSCRLIIRAGQRGVSARVVGRDVIVEVPKGRVHKFEIAAKLSPKELSIAALAHSDWHRNEHIDENAHRLAAAAASGDAPLLAPTRTLTVAYATQRPLLRPGFGRPLILPRAPDATSALLADDSLSFHRPSTGRIDVYASWVDPVDDKANEGWRTSASELYAGGVDMGVEDGKPFDPVELTEPARSPLSHDFGDTKHHEVSYRAAAMSRFADFYSAEVTDDPDNVTLVSEPVTLHVPSTAPPSAPDIAYVVPTFRSDEMAANPNSDFEQRDERHGDGLRVYMNRGWFSSGKGEQLALVVATSPNPPDNVRDVVSEWGQNPLRDSAPLPGPLQLEHVWGGAQRIENWRLDGGRVGLVVYDVRFSDAHGLPFVDIEFLSQRAFMPLVRLALARYQEHAIANCHLSAIVHADFVPLAPGRALTVRKLSTSAWKLALRGYSYRQPGFNAPEQSTSVVHAHIECMPRTAPEEDAASWRPIGKTVTLRPEPLEDWRYHWGGQVHIHDEAFLSWHWRRRLVVQEFEPFETAGEIAGDGEIPLPDRSRLVSAHTVLL